MTQKEEIDSKATVVFPFGRVELVRKHVGGGCGYNIIDFNDQSDYLIWKKQLKMKLQFMDITIYLG